MPAHVDDLIADLLGSDEDGGLDAPSTQVHDVEARSLTQQFNTVNQAIDPAPHPTTGDAHLPQRKLHSATDSTQDATSSMQASMAVSVHTAALSPASNRLAASVTDASSMIDADGKAGDAAAGSGEDSDHDDDEDALLDLADVLVTSGTPAASHSVLVPQSDRAASVAIAAAGGRAPGETSPALPAAALSPSSLVQVAAASAAGTSEASGVATKSPSAHPVSGATASSSSAAAPLSSPTSEHVGSASATPKAQSSTSGGTPVVGVRELVMPFTAPGSLAAKHEAAHETALRRAHEAEQSLLSGCDVLDGDAHRDPLSELSQLLSGAFDEWPSQGRPDAHGAMVGGAVALKLEEVDAAKNWQQKSTLGSAKVIAIAGTAVAVGTSLGAVLLFHQPSSQTPSPAAPSSGTIPARPSDGSYQIGESRSEADGVCSLGFSHMTAPGDAVWLLVGHGSGAVAVWDLQRRPARLVTNITGQHNLPVVHVSFFPTRGTTCALTADRRGRLLMHTFTNQLLRTGSASRMLLDGGLGPVAAVAHLAPFHSPAAGGATVEESAAAAPAPGAAGQSKTEPAPSPRVGDGVVAVMTAAAVHVARIKAAGEMVPLYTLPRPPGVAPSSVPYAAWRPGRRSKGGGDAGAAAAAAPAVSVSDMTSVPLATLAVAWEQQLQVLDVALLGDHASLDAPLAPVEGAAAPGRLSLYPRLGQVRPAVSAAEALTAPLAAQLASRFPLRVKKAWSSSSTSHSAVPRGGAAEHADEDGGAVLMGLHWYDSEALGLVLQQGLQMKLVAVDMDMNMREQVECLDSPSPSSHIPSSCHSMVSGQGSRLLLLGASGSVHCSRLMTWQERLRTLQETSKWRLGLRHAVDFFQAAAQRRPTRDATGSSSNGSAAATASSLTKASQRGGWPAFVGEQRELHQWILALVVGLVAAALGPLQATTLAADGRSSADRTGGARNDGEREQKERLAHDANLLRECREAAQAAVCCCLVVDAQQVLFNRVFPMFRDAGAAPVLLECLEPHILQDQLPRLAPEVMQALVEHYAVTCGRPDRVERCVLHMDLLSLDLDQVIKLCEAHQLYSALIYIYNRILDYRKPLLDLLAAVAFASTHAQRSLWGYKLLVYLRCTFTGEAFPPGSGHLAVSTPSARDDLKAQLLGLLLFLNRVDLAREWRRSLEDISAICVDPHPLLQVLLSVDVRAAMVVLGEAVVGWDAVETDLRAAAGQPATELDSVLTATQVLVNALVGLIESGQFRALQQQQQQQQRQRQQIPAGSSSSKANAPLSGGALRSCEMTADLGVAMDFIAGLLAARRVNVAPAFALKVLRHVAQAASIANINSFPGPAITCDTPATAATADAGSTHVDAADVSGDPDIAQGSAAGVASRGGPRAAEPAAQVAQVEELFAAVLTAVGVTGSPGQPPDPLKLSFQESEMALQLAQRHGLAAATALVYHLRGDCSSALAAHLQHGLAPFDYIERFLSDAPKPSSLQALRQAVLERSLDLVRRDASRTAALVLHSFSGDQAEVLTRCAAEPQAQYMYLKAMIAQEQLRLTQEQEALKAGRGVPPARHGTSSPGAPPPATAAPCPELLQSPAVCHAYVALLCRYDPPAVLPFLMTHQHYDVKACLGPCREHNVMDAQAYLHERLGDYDSAMQLFLRAILQTNVSLVSALRTGNFLHASHPSSTTIKATDQLPAVSSGPLDPPRQWSALSGLAGLAAHMPSAQSSLNSMYSLLSTAAAAAGVVTSGGRGALSTTTTISAGPDVAAAGQQGAGSHTRSAFGDAASSVSGDTMAHSASFTEHIEWLSGLSPQVRMVLPRVCGAPGAGALPRNSSAFTTQLSRTMSSINSGHLGSSPPHLASSASPPPRAPPPELTTAWLALEAATAFCHRNSKKVRHLADGASQVSAHGHWFQLLRVYVDQLRRVPLAEADERRSDPHSATAAGAVEAAVVDRVVVHVLSAFMEVVINCMADHMPLDLIVRHILHSFGHDSFSRFRGTLLGLLSACAYERNIMGTTNRLVTRDVYRAVQSNYSARIGNRSAATTLADDTAERTGGATTPAAAAPEAPSGGDPGWVSLTDLVHGQLLDQHRRSRMAAGVAPERSASPSAPDALHLIPHHWGGTAHCRRGLYSDAKDQPRRNKPTRIDVRSLERHHRISDATRPVKPFARGRNSGHKGAVAGARARDDSFDIDELLSWSNQTARTM